MFIDPHGCFPTHILWFFSWKVPFPDNQRAGLDCYTTHFNASLHHLSTLPWRFTFLKSFGCPALWHLLKPGRFLGWQYFLRLSGFQLQILRWDSKCFYVLSPIFHCIWRLQSTRREVILCSHFEKRKSPLPFYPSSATTQQTLFLPNRASLNWFA